MTDPLDTEGRAEAERAEAKRAKFLAQRERDDVQAFLSTESGRRIVHGFLYEAGVDRSTFRVDALAMAFASGWQDAGSWWLNKIRLHCPEREAQMRNEARKDSRAPNEEPDDD